MRGCTIRYFPSRQPAKNLTFGVYLTHIMVVAYLYNGLEKSFDLTVSRGPPPAAAAPSRRCPRQAAGETRPLAAVLCRAEGGGPQVTLAAYIFVANYTLAVFAALALWFLVEDGVPDRLGVRGRL
jgi:hypothetical protein